MYLKSIEIHGFKSFAQKTLLEFSKGTKDRYSITAIVGPNGSGKSNVSDAIRWVMGEQKMSKLRAKKGHDIIFSGSDAKGQMGMASVTLHLDNSDKRVDIEYDELTITRKLYRTGESEYLLNGNAVRLIDLQILLAKAQFGHGSYSVVGQGTIDKMLLQSPADRKDFFDEASGIKEFQIKRHQASLKLGRTKENIDQASLLLQEVEPRLKSLSRQVKKLEERHDVELTLREKQEQYYTTLYQFHQGYITELTASLAGITKDYDQANGKLTALQHELATLAKEASRQDAFDALQKEYKVVADKKNTLERERAVIAGRMQTEYSKAGKQNVGWLENKIEGLGSELSTLQESIEDAQKKVATLESELSEKRKAVQEASVACATARAKIGQLQQQTIEQKSEQTFFQFTGLRAVQAILEERHQFGTVYGGVAQLGSVEKQYHLAMDVAAGGHLSSIVVKDDTVAQKGINYLREHRLGTATFLPLNKIKPRFISQDAEDLAEEPGVHGLAIDLVRFEEKFEDVFSYVFGNTLIVEDLDVARRIGIGKVRMVTLDGDVLERSGSMKGGFRNRKNQQGLSFAHGHRAQLVGGNTEELEEQLVTLQSDLEKQEIVREQLQAGVLSHESGLQIARGELQLLETKKAQLEGERGGLEQELSLHTMSPDEYDSVMKDVADQREALNVSIAAVEKELEAAQGKIDRFNKEEEEKKQRVFQLQDAMQQEQNNLNNIVSEKNQKQIELAKYETKQEDLGHELYQEMQTTLEALANRGVPVLEFNALDAVQVEIQKLKYKLTLIGGIDEEVVEEYTQTKERYDGLTEQLTDLEKAMKDLETLIEELDSIMKKRRAKAFKQIKKEFNRYFQILFEGGKADLVEIYGEEGSKVAQSDDDGEEEMEEEDFEDEKKKKKRKKKVLLGIDVIANPPGKKIKHLQTLSGGERTMTSIALVCAILRTNPSPFVVLDEVEAALDEANSVRLTKIMQELAEESQFILITHNRATMHAADALYGVTMGNDGMSHLLSVKLAEAQKAVE